MNFSCFYRRGSRKTNGLFLQRLLLFVCAASCTAVLRPRGVPLSKKVFYNPSQNFNCLDGSGTFPFHYVNDDFCDCEDGSDEPGTAACGNGLFICNNYGHVPVTLPSSRVNDGICDCCDASDEYNSTADCLNTCKEVGLLAQKEAQQVYDYFVKGNETRHKYITQGKARRQDYQNKLKKLLDKEKEALKVKLEKQDLKENADSKERKYLGLEKQLKEEQEKRRLLELKRLEEQKQQEEADARKAFSELDVNKDGKVTFAEVQSFPRFDYDGDGKVSEKEAKFYMHKKDEITLEDFLANGWRVMQPAFTMEDSGKSDAVEPEPSSPFVQSFSNEQRRVPSGSHRDIDEKEKSAVIEDAAIKQKEFAEANKILQDIQAEVWALRKKLNMDYGPEDEFMILENQCFDFTDKRYVYRLCPFDKAIQIMRHNKDETLLGLWNEWVKSESGKHSQMSYTRGSTCWNGPSRSVLVKLECGLKNEVISVVETSTCSYVFEFTTPASCKDVPVHVQSILNRNILNL